MNEKLKHCKGLDDSISDLHVESGSKMLEFQFFTGGFKGWIQDTVEEDDEVRRVV